MGAWTKTRLCSGVAEAYLWGIADSLRAILEFVQRCDLSDHEQNRMLRRAVERQLSICERP